MTTLHREPIPGLPDSLLADCVLTMGKRGGGKSYFFRVAMERALTKRIRCGWVDGMGVGWGITVTGDGKHPGFQNVVVFGGEHGHLPIAENAGKALGRTLAKSTFSWVLDLTTLPSKASRVRFMADFMEALYENCSTPLLLFLDEVDLWAPQMILDKQGPSAALLGAMHEVVRRGRVKGLSVWMATQRPAEVSKGIISQADALVTFKLMAPQDLDAAMAWMKGHVGKAKASEWAAEIPTLTVGSAIVYLTEPAISIKRVAFPLIQTLDTFRPPKKGEAAVSDKARAHVDLDAIRSEIGTVEEELKANDPKLLRERIKQLENDAKKAAKAVPAAPVKMIDVEREAAASEEGYFEGLKNGWPEGWRQGYGVGWMAHGAQMGRTIADVSAPGHFTVPDAPPAPAQPKRPSQAAPNRAERPVPRQARRPAAGPLNPPVVISNADRTGPERKILTALAEWRSIGFTEPTREQVSVLAGYHMRTGSFLNALGSLRSLGVIEYGQGTVFLTDAGQAEARAEPFDDQEKLHKRIREVLDGPQTKIFNYLLTAGQEKVERETVATQAGYHIRTGSFLNALGRLRTLTVIEYASGGKVYLKPWVFMEQEP